MNMFHGLSIYCTWWTASEFPAPWLVANLKCKSSALTFVSTISGMGDWWKTISKMFIQIKSSWLNNFKNFFSSNCVDRTETSEERSHCFGCIQWLLPGLRTKLCHTVHSGQSGLLRGVFQTLNFLYNISSCKIVIEGQRERDRSGNWGRAASGYSSVSMIVEEHLFNDLCKWEVNLLS